MKYHVDVYKMDYFDSLVHIEESEALVTAEDVVRFIISRQDAEWIGGPFFRLEEVDE